MEIMSFFESDRQDELTAKIERADWGAAKFLVSLLRENRIDFWGDDQRVLYKDL